jgi:hypothetical protein
MQRSDFVVQGSAMKIPNFFDVLKRDKLFFQVFRVSCLLREFKFPPKFLGYLTGHCSLPVIFSRKGSVSSGKELGVLCH